MIDFQFIKLHQLNLDYVESWFTRVCESENKKLANISILIGDDEWLIDYNRQYLNHDFYTDIISFDYCEGDYISGDLLISLERVEDNSKKYNVSRETELNRVMVHGLLHLIGYGDKSEDKIAVMREKENLYLSLL